MLEIEKIELEQHEKLQKIIQDREAMNVLLQELYKKAKEQNLGDSELGRITAFLWEVQYGEWSHPIYNWLTYRPTWYHFKGFKRVIHVK